jgi:hypothetical protein
MLGALLYGIVCFVIGAVVVWFSLLFTKLGKSAERPMAGRLFSTWILMLALPYIWVEFNTWRSEEEFLSGVDTAAEKGMTNGDFAYLKVKGALGESARVLVVTEGEEEWGGTWRNMYNLDFERDSEGWKLISVHPVNTQDGDSAGFSFPPYW